MSLTISPHDARSTASETVLSEWSFCLGSCKMELVCECSSTAEHAQLHCARTFCALAAANLSCCSLRRNFQNYFQSYTVCTIAALRFTDPWLRLRVTHALQRCCQIDVFCRNLASLIVHKNMCSRRKSCYVIYSQ